MPIKKAYLCQETLPNLLKVLELLLDSIKNREKGKPYKDEYSLIAYEAFSQDRRTKSIAKQCVELTNKALYSHRFEEASKLLWMLCQDGTVFNIFIFRAMMIVLENLENFEDKNEITWKFFNEIQHLDLINKKECLLEYIIYVLKHKVPDAREKYEALSGRKKITVFGKNIHFSSLFSIFDAYLSYLHYADNKSSQLGLSSQADRPADILLKFRQILKTPGDWDIFILKLIEMFNIDAFPDQISREVPVTEKNETGENETGENPNQCNIMEDILCEYATMNPTNLNAHIYLCSFLSIYNPKSKKLMKHLQIIADLSPSDERVLLLIEKLKETGNGLQKSVELAFMFLDYPSNSKNEEAWKVFSELLQLSKRNKCITRTIRKFWESRKNNWLYMYFNTIQLYSEMNSTLAFAKADALSHLDENNAFIDEVSKRFSSSGI